ncbi:hypothetical protein CHARACLAT_033622 [Characodon lateralis]|uniref:Uncharacterized protein n=1 Tax=Characodon lateralis TaxID=208331 RepID=A0ABU7DYE6_9TELE|nr:hypothetical protein [Characodon lateralis]
MDTLKNRTDHTGDDILQRNKSKNMADGQSETVKFEKENTLLVEVVGDTKIPVLDIMRNIRLLCGSLLACRQVGGQKYEVTMGSAAGKRRLLDGFKIGAVTIVAKELTNDELVVSFLNLPAYIAD